MKKIKLISLMLIAMILTSCVKDAKETVVNGDFQIQFLFEHDGCKMYRFRDGGRYIYWSECKGKIQSDYETSSGKSTYTNHEETINN